MADNKGASGQGIPQNMREMAESSVAQAKRAVEQYFQAAHRALETVESSTEAAQAGARDLRTKAVDYAESNIRGAFDFAERLVRAQNLQEIVSLQQEFLRQQTEQMSRQMQELGSRGAAGGEGTAGGGGEGAAGGGGGGGGRRTKR